MSSKKKSAKKSQSKQASEVKEAVIKKAEKAAQKTVDKAFIAETTIEKKLVSLVETLRKYPNQSFFSVFSDKKGKFTSLDSSALLSVNETTRLVQLLDEFDLCSSDFQSSFRSDADEKKQICYVAKNSIFPKDSVNKILTGQSESFVSKTVIPESKKLPAQLGAKKASDIIVRAFGSDYASCQARAMYYCAAYFAKTGISTFTAPEICDFVKHRTGIDFRELYKAYTDSPIHQGLHRLSKGVTNEVTETKDNKVIDTFARGVKDALFKTRKVSIKGRGCYILNPKHKYPDVLESQVNAALKEMCERNTRVKNSGKTCKC